MRFFTIAALIGLSAAVKLTEEGEDSKRGPKPCDLEDVSEADLESLKAAAADLDDGEIEALKEELKRAVKSGEISKDDVKEAAEALGIEDAELAQEDATVEDATVSDLEEAVAELDDGEKKQLKKQLKKKAKKAVEDGEVDEDDVKDAVAAAEELALAQEDASLEDATASDLEDAVAELDDGEKKQLKKELKKKAKQAVKDGEVDEDDVKDAAAAAEELGLAQKGKKPKGEMPEGEEPEGEESEGDDTLADIAGKVWEAAAGDDGELDGDEAMKMARKVCDMKGWEVTDDELEEWIDEVGEEIDTDMSGTISGEEALAAWDAMIGEMELETDEIAELAVDFMETGDKDGKISKDEAK